MDSTTDRATDTDARAHAVPPVEEVVSKPLRPDEDAYASAELELRSTRIERLIAQALADS